MSRDGRHAPNKPNYGFYFNVSIGYLSVYHGESPQLLKMYHSLKHGTRLSVKVVNDTTKESYYLSLKTPPEIEEDDHLEYELNDSSKGVLLKLINSEDTWKAHFMFTESNNRGNVIKEVITKLSILFTPYAGQ